jgi:hypothetical protein
MLELAPETGDDRKRQEMQRHMHQDAIDRVLRKHAAAIGITRGYLDNTAGSATECSVRRISGADRTGHSAD